MRRSLLLFACLGVAAGTACGVGSAERAAEPVPVPAVEAVRARAGALPLEQRLSGVVRAENQVTIRPEIEAPIREVLVRSGDAVERGQPLVRLDDATLRDQLRQAEASVRLAQASAREARARTTEIEAQSTRAVALAAQALISDLEVETLAAQLEAARAAVDQAAARVEQAQATVEERRSALDKTVVRAPVAGRIGRRDAEVGMLADPGAPLFVIGNLSELIVEVPLTESLLEHVREGQRVRIGSPVLGAETLEARLARISPFLESGSFSTRGEIDLARPDPRLRPGMFVTVDVIRGASDEATIVPTSALWEDPQSAARGLWVVDFDAAAEPRPDEVAQLAETPSPAGFREIEVVAEGAGLAGVRGVEPGEWVVTVGQHLLRTDGEAAARVRPTSIERVLELQGLQREDLLRGFLERQQAWARTRGAEPPSNEEFLGGGAGGGAGAAP